MARTPRSSHLSQRKSPPPLRPPARLLGDEIGQHKSQIHPKHVAQASTGKGLLVVIWYKPSMKPVEIFLPCKKNDRIRLIDFKALLEVAHLHPKMPLKCYVRRPRSKQGSWTEVNWDNWLDGFGPRHRLLLCWRRLDDGTLRDWNQHSASGSGDTASVVVEVYWEDDDEMPEPEGPEAKVQAKL
ncbi:hypothetical protein K438DRAFT_1790037 [Mycena galopus ATCC 62051]|nr:hypothetical protein K438DRAFT_1790037 [Mycena galopus ATCC 62051]